MVIGSGLMRALVAKQATKHGQLYASDARAGYSQNDKADFAPAFLPALAINQLLTITMLENLRLNKRDLPAN